MTKRWMCMLLAAMLMLSCALPALAQETAEAEEKTTRVLTVSTVAGLLLLAENCRLDSYSVGLTVQLKRDIDLQGEDFPGIPIFCGTFEGNGHTISGLSISGDGSQQGLFRYLTETALVRELHLEGDIQPQGSRSSVGGIVGENAGQIQACSFAGQITGGDFVGGIAGTNTVTGIIEDCKVSGSITGNHFLGGIVGENAGVIRNCENTVRINTTPQQNQVSLSDITLDTLVDTESASTVTDVGGIAGTSTGVIRDCVNRGDIGYHQMGYNIGGIVGSQSGTVLGCKNYGSISGRKEVGGIVGHLKPANVIEYSEDITQILKGQLKSLNSAINQASANVQETSWILANQVNELRDAVQDASDSISMLAPDPENPTIPDADSLEAARNSLSESFSTLTWTLEGMDSAAYSSMGALSTNLMAIEQQVSAMGATLDNASETVGGRIEDLSDLDTEEDLSGKIADCINLGSVTADLNVGGIAGAMALESELDAAENIQLSGELSLNFVSKIRSVIRDCVNRGPVTDGRQHMGGITGYQTLGAIKTCQNTAAVGSSGADYVGGIVGRSTGYIRDSSAKCILTGASCVGGIAGSAAIATSCRTMVEIQGGTEKVGAILGITEANFTEEEYPIQGNLYICLSADPGGIDGISYSGLAEASTQDAFLGLEDLPEMFRSVTVTFRFEKGKEQQFTLKHGGALPVDQIPEVPEREGFDGNWDGLAEADLSNVCFDVAFEPVYTNQITVIQTGLARDGLPVLLVQGTFGDAAFVAVAESEQRPPVDAQMWLVESWDITLADAKSVTGGRYLMPDTDADTLHLLVRLSDGSWQERTFTENGSYLVFSMDGTENAIALLGEDAPVWYWYAAGTAVAAVAAAGLLLLLLRKRRKA